MKRLITKQSDREIMKSYVRDFVYSIDCDDANIDPSDTESIVTEITQTPQFNEIVKRKDAEYKYPNQKAGLIQQLVNDYVMTYLYHN